MHPIYWTTMFPFDAPLITDDDFALLAAYAAAENEAEQARKAEVFATQSEPKPTQSSADVGPTCLADVASPAVLDENVSADGDTDGEHDASEARPWAAVWVARRREVAGLARDRLAPTHGRLIAHGLLQFQLLGQTEGVVYRLTPAGRKALAASLEAQRAGAEAA